MKKNETLKWILRIIANIILILVLSSIFTYLIGYLANADKGTNEMVLAMGFMIVIPAIILNLFFLIPTIFVKEKWAKIFFSFLPVILTLVLILIGMNMAWTPLALFASLLVANTIWYFGLNKKTTANTVQN
jgi:uncharacterized protein YacL